MNGNRKCVRPNCHNMLTGQQQVCNVCRENDAKCKKCSKPHGGKLVTTKLCPPCRAKTRAKPRKAGNPEWTAEDDAKLREIYATYNNREIGVRAREVFPTRPRWAIKRRANIIGASTVRQKEPPWSPAEEALLQEHGWKTPERVALIFRQQGYKRTLTAIGIKMKRLRVRESIDGMTATGLAEMLDVDNHLVVRWIDGGLIKASRSGTTGDNHDRWHIATADIREFLLAHPEQYTLTKLERAGSRSWFAGLVMQKLDTDNAAAPMPATERTVMLAGERVPLSALADMCGRDVTTLVRRIDGLGMSVEQAAFGAEDIVDAPVQNELGKEVARELEALMVANKLSMASWAKRAGVPILMARRLMQGEMMLLPSTLTKMLTTVGLVPRVQFVADDAVGARSNAKKGKKTNG